MSTAAYIHLPWCEKKCPYCDFNSYEGEVSEDDYVQALERDLAFEMQGPRIGPISSVFIGGGTPSLFSERGVGKILDALARHPGLRKGAEITLEANPGSSEARRFAGYRRAGVNRLSIGVQSFDDALLHRIGRIHSAAQARAAVDAARTAGFDNFNLDLMYHLPDQTTEQVLADIEQALELEPPHLSWYELTLEAGTAFGRRPPTRASDDEAWTMTRLGSARIRAAGFRRYEVSAWARPGHRSQHNLNYWRFGDYLGLGAGAHGKRRFGDRTVRRAKLRSPARFMRHAGEHKALASEIEPDPQQLRLEFALNALRLHDGFPLALYQKTTGRELSELSPGLIQAESLGLARVLNGRLSPTRLGRLHLNRLIECWA